MTLIVSHRGACRHAPENTIASGLRAAELGADIVELDVRTSADGVLYLLHDAMLDRTTSGTGPVAGTDSGTLDRLNAGGWFGPSFAGEPLPRLDAFIAALKGRVGFYVEVKAAEPEALAACLANARLDAPCIVYSEDSTLRARLRQALPRQKHMVNFTDHASISEAASTGATILEFNARDMTARRVAEARAAGFEVMMHTPARDLAAFARAFDLGIDYLNIDFPDIAARLRAARRASPPRPG